MSIISKITKLFISCLFFSSLFASIDDCINEDCEGSQNFLCEYNEVEGPSHPGECHDYSEANGIDSHGIWWDADYYCVETPPRRCCSW